MACLQYPRCTPPLLVHLLQVESGHCIKGGAGGVWVLRHTYYLHRGTVGLDLRTTCTAVLLAYTWVLLTSVYCWPGSFYRVQDQGQDPGRR